MITSNEDWTRVVLYGTYDGFVRSTNESLQIAVRLDDGERVEIPSECVMSADQIVKRDEIKLKDVIKRIKYFDLVTQAVWVNGILNELGSGYGLHKYHEGYKQGKLDGAMEREKVQVPQFVADWYEEHKDNLEYNIWDWMKYNLEPQKRENVIFSQWLGKTVNNPVETLIKMKLYGYEVEKEKRYFVRLKGVVDNLRLLRHNLPTNTWTIGSEEQCFNASRAHTRKELEEAGFGWLFDCEGIEIEEVE